MNNYFYSIFKKFPINLVDVGASGGIKDNWKKMDEFLRIVGFEPDDAAYNELIKSKKENETFLKIALHNKEEDLDFYVTRKQEVSSIYQPDSDLLSSFPDKHRFDVLKKVTVKANTLDSTLLLNNIKDIDTIKIDTQGSGLNILEGAVKTLEDTFCVEIETEFLPIYKNQQLFAEIDIFMRNNGFYLFDLRPWYWKRDEGKQYGNPRGQIIFSDCVYLKSPKSIEGMIAERDTDNDKKGKVIKIIAICNLFGYLDYSLEIFNKNKNLFDLKEKDVFTQFLESQILWRTGSYHIGNLEYIKET
ncbi:MAG: FkbM family methyltransferase [Tenuifilaceae bacterium]